MLCLDDDRLHAEGVGVPGLAAPDGAALAEAAILAVVLPLLHEAGVRCVKAACAGVAGALAAPDAAVALAGRLGRRLPALMMAVASDAATSHAGALGGGPGVVLAAGTGAVALAVGADGTMHRADGWGPWLGDEGGGAWVGLQGLRAALRSFDKRGPATALEAAAAIRFGPLPGLAMLMEGHISPPRLAASFAGDVALVAQAGDAVAAALLRHAAAALADAVRAASAPLTEGGPVRVAVVGGLLSLGAVLTGPLFSALQGEPALDLVPAYGTALDGARLLALDAGTIHERHIVRCLGPGASQHP